MEDLAEPIFQTATALGLLGVLTSMNTETGLPRRTAPWLIAVLLTSGCATPGQSMSPGYTLRADGGTVLAQRAGEGPPRERASQSESPAPRRQSPQPAASREPTAEATEAERREAAEARQAVHKVLADVRKARALIAGSLAILEERRDRGRVALNEALMPFVEYGQKQVKWMDEALEGATALVEEAERVDEPEMQRALLRMSGPKLEAALLGSWVLSAWVDLVKQAFATVTSYPQYSEERLLADLWRARQRMEPAMDAFASQEAWRVEETANWLPGLVESLVNQFSETRQGVQVALKNQAELMQMMQVYDLVFTLLTMRMAMPQGPPAAPLVLGAGLAMGADGVMIGTQVVVTAEGVELLRQLVRAGVLSVPVASAAVRLNAGPMLMAQADKDLPKGVREALGDGPEVRAMRETGRAGAGMSEPPRHHVLPREHREWFEKRGFTGDMSIDQFCVRMEPAEHQAIHGGGSWRLGRIWAGEWNQMIMSVLRDAEVAAGRMLTRSEILSIVAYRMKGHKIPMNFTRWRRP